MNELNNTLDTTQNKSIDIIDKINNVVRSMLNEQINETTANMLSGVFAKRKDMTNWKNPIGSLEFAFTFKNYERVIQAIGLLAMAYSYFHGSYELSRVGNTDTVSISSNGYYYYKET